MHTLLKPLIVRLLHLITIALVVTPICVSVCVCVRACCWLLLLGGDRKKGVCVCAEMGAATKQVVTSSGSNINRIIPTLTL